MKCLICGRHFQRIPPVHLYKHNISYAEYKKMGGQCYSEEEKKEYSQKNNGKNNPNHNSKTNSSERMKKKWQNSEYREKVCNGVGAAAKRRISLSGPPFLGQKHSEETKQKISRRIKEKWNNRDYAYNILSSNSIRPNNSEKTLLRIINSISSEEWNYIGDGSFSIGCKHPDFICKEGNKLIELYGDYWHKGQNPQDRIDYFKEYGYECLVIWEKELKNEEELRQRISSFCRFKRMAQTI